MYNKLIPLFVGLLLIVFGCSKKEEPQTPASSPSTLPKEYNATENPTPANAPNSVAPADSPLTRSAVNDFTKPFLSEEKMSKFISSLKEDKNPLEFVLGKNGKMGNISEMQAKMDEYNSFAKKYGFADYQEYIGVWGRITLAETRLSVDGMKKGTRDMLTKSVESAKEQLKKPNLNPEMRKIYEEQVANGEKSLANMNKQADKPMINDIDFELYRTHKNEIDAATKKFKKH